MVAKLPHLETALMLPPKKMPGERSSEGAYLILHRLSRFWDVFRVWTEGEVTTAWVAEMLVRFDGGPMLDGGELGPVLRALGFRPVLRRAGERRVRTWIVPGGKGARVGRPLGGVRGGDPSVWPRHWGGKVEPLRGRRV
jgi:hypothetical protein